MNTCRTPARRRLVPGAGAVLLLMLLTACTGAGPAPRPLPTQAYSAKPNIVFVLTDDLSSDLIKFMPHVVAMQQAGTSFRNYTVTDSLCCPSRASIFSGRYPHDTHVFTNEYPDGGFGAFYVRGEEKHTFATALSAQGYRTAMMGKYLNGYNPEVTRRGAPVAYIPPGWSSWYGAGDGYHEYDYPINENGRIVHYGSESKDYLTTVLQNKAVDFINDSAQARKPFMVEIATFTPHLPYVPAPQDVRTFPGLRQTHDASFDRLPAHAPKWLVASAGAGLSRHKLIRIGRVYRQRVQDVQSIDRMIGTLQTTLRESGQLSNTVFVFSSDNGYHLGQHGLAEGKLTAYDTDIRVPLVVAGPGVAVGAVRNDATQNVDLAPTFEELAGAPVPADVDGHSLVPLLHGESPPWPSLALVEHHGPATDPADPDHQSLASGNPPSYDAIRSADWIYVHYVDGEREYYDLRTDPFEMDNLAGSLSRARLAQLDRMVNQLTTCHGGVACWAAGRPGTA